MKTIAIITARGGSKRIPRKNIKEFCGRPILSYSIDAAVKSGMFDEVMVSTDDEEIAEISKQYGAKVPFLRSEKTSNDFATTADVLREVIETYRKKGVTFDKACCIYPTAPFVTADKLKSAMDELINSGAFSVVPVVAYSFPPQRGLKVVGGELKYVYPEHMFTRSQDLEAMYHDCGQFYCFDVEGFLGKNTLFGDNTRPIVMDELEVQDIDNMTDWVLAEIKYKMMIERETNNELRY